MQPINYYLLILLVFLLAAAIIFLYDRLKRSRNAEEGGTIKEKEQRLFKLYQNLEDMILSFEEYVDEAKEEIARERDAKMNAYSSLHEEDTVQLSEKYTPSFQKKKDERAHIPVQEMKRPGLVKDETLLSGVKSKKGSKVDDVRRLNSEGLQEETIAKELGLSRGEVSLILGMLNS